MSTTTRRLPLSEAESVAGNLIDLLSPGCERIRVAGSIRRRKPDVGDIEIVAIPRRGADLFGAEYGSALGPILDRLCRDGTLARLKGGEHFRQFVVTAAGCKLDLFTPSREAWGVIFTQRTGSAEFAHQLMTSRQAYTSTGRPGLMPAGMRVYRARLWRGEAIIPTPEEEDFFAAINLPWVTPEERR